LIVLAVITFVGATDLAETELSLESHLGRDFIQNLVEM